MPNKKKNKKSDFNTYGTYSIILLIPTVQQIQFMAITNK